MDDVKVEKMRSAISKNTTIDEICGMANIVETHRDLDGVEYLDGIAAYVCEDPNELEIRLGDMVDDELFEAIMRDFKA